MSFDHLSTLLHLVIWLALTGLLPDVLGTGHIEVHFLFYSDECQEHLNTNPCDPMFSFCLSSPQNGSLDVDNCDYSSTGQSDTDFHNTNYINMTDLKSISGHRNPWIVSVQKFLGPSVMLVVKVVDSDYFGDDHMHTWGKVITEPVWPSKNQSVWKSLVMSDLSYKLGFKVRMYCDPYYFTSKCDLYCKARNSSKGHYNCDYNTGDKICLSGWQGENCTEDVDECALGYCINGQCTNLPGDYKCVCEVNYTGKNCSMRLTPCQSQPCLNGGTCYTYGFENIIMCMCTEEWTGEICENRKDPCQLQPCLNNGSCTNSPDGFGYNCSCVYPFTGENCDTKQVLTRTTRTTRLKTPPDSYKTRSSTSIIRTEVPVSKLTTTTRTTHLKMLPDSHKTRSSTSIIRTEVPVSELTKTTRTTHLKMLPDSHKTRSSTSIIRTEVPVSELTKTTRTACLKTLPDSHKTRSSTSIIRTEVPVSELTTTTRTTRLKTQPDSHKTRSSTSIIRTEVPVSELTTSTSMQASNVSLEGKKTEVKQEGHNTSFQLWFVAVIAGTVCFVIAAGMIFIIKKRSQKGTHRITPPSTSVTNDRNFLLVENSLYASLNGHNSENEQVLPPLTITSSADDGVVTTTMPRRVGEADGSEQRKKSSDDVENTTDSAVRSSASLRSGESQTNAYADFRSLMVSQSGER